MSGQLKEIRTRITSVISTQQITKAMKMVSAAKLRKAQDRITMMRPYADKLYDMLGNIMAGLEGDISINLGEERPIKNVLIVTLTSDRGLCGGFNSSIIKAARAHINANYSDLAASGNVTIMPLGKKSFDYYKNQSFPIDKKNISVFTELTFEHAAKIVEDLTATFQDGTYDRIDVIYSRFKNAATQVPEVEQFLPIAKLETIEEEESTTQAEYIFEPDKEEIMNILVPKILNTTFFKYLLDSNASEHGARMTAMDQATENANELLGDLRLYYNRARQAAITTELTEIVSGAAALSN